MRPKTIISVFALCLFVLASLVVAGGKHKHDANVIKVDAKGNKVALCACGKEVSVNEATPTVTHGNETFYVCSDACQDYFSKNVSKIEPKLHVEILKAKAEAGTLGNVYKVDESGAMTAKCGCGMDIKVSDKTLSREHDGQKYYLCSDGCAAMFDKKADEVIQAAKSKIGEAKK